MEIRRCFAFVVTALPRCLHNNATESNQNNEETIGALIHTGTME